MVELRDPAERVSPRARTMWLVECSLEAVVVAGAALVGAAVWDAVDVTWWLVVALLAGAASYAVGVPQWRYRVHRWEASRTAVYTQRGWWSRERRIAPLSRVQTVDLAEGPLARLFGLATLTVTTASAAGAADRRPGPGHGAGAVGGPDRPRAGRGGRRHVSEEWQRLDPRMLLVHPVDEVRRFLPALLGILLLGSARGSLYPALVALLVLVVVGLVRYLTTSYRITDTRVELQRGLLSRQRLSTPLDRVRTVDLTASVTHRLLGLTAVRIGTGSVATDAGDRLELNGLATAEAARVRALLLRAADAAQPAPDPTLPAPAAPAAVATFRPGWLRYAPFSGQGLVVIGGIVSVGSQVLEQTQVRIDLEEVDLPVGSGLLVASAVLALLVGGAAVTVLGYLVANWRLTLTRAPGSWHLRRGLLTTHETSIDAERVAGVSVGEDAGLRWTGGARLAAIVTGVDRSERGSEVLVPPAPADEVRSAATAVVGSEPLTAPLSTHGAAATRRRWLRALVPTTGLALALAGLVVAGGPAWLLVPAAAAPAVGVALARDRARALGHALTDEYVVTRSGSVLRRREVLARQHVIGWTFRDTWFQRRVGLTTLHATTAGGRGYVTVMDLPVGDGVALADRAVPGLVGPFTAAT